MNLSQLMAEIRMIWKERDSKGYQADFQAKYPLLKNRIKSFRIYVREQLNDVIFETS